MKNISIQKFTDKTILIILGTSFFIITFIFIVIINNQGYPFPYNNTIPTEERLPVNITKPGTYKEIFTYRGLERQASIHIPPAYTEENTSSMPLVLILHGYGGDAQSMEQITGFSEIADTHGFITVYPEGIEHSWNAYICCGKAQKNNIDDMGFLVHIIDNLSDRLTIDLQRVYITGYSNGGMLAYYVAAQFPKRIAAIAPVAASIGGFRKPNAPLIQPSKFSDPVSALIIHGKEDEVIPYEGGERTIEQIAFTSVEESITFWKEHNTCSNQGTERISSDGLITQNTFFCANGATIQTYIIEQGDHTWFDTEPGFQELTQHETLSEIIWNFFEQNPNPQSVEEIEEEITE